MGPSSCLTWLLFTSCVARRHHEAVFSLVNFFRFTLVCLLPSYYLLSSCAGLFLLDPSLGTFVLPMKYFPLWINCLYSFFKLSSFFLWLWPKNLGLVLFLEATLYSNLGVCKNTAVRYSEKKKNIAKKLCGNQTERF